MMTVKVHYSVTRALRVSTSITYQQLQNLICKKFDQPEDSLTLWCKKKNGEVNEIKSEQSLREVAASLDDGFRITLWAYDKFEVRRCAKIGVVCFLRVVPPFEETELA